MWGYAHISYLFFKMGKKAVVTPFHHGFYFAQERVRNGKSKSKRKI